VRLNLFATPWREANPIIGNLVTLNEIVREEHQRKNDEFESIQELIRNWPHAESCSIASLSNAAVSQVQLNSMIKLFQFSNHQV
jgi:hypothetical protein